MDRRAEQTELANARSEIDQLKHEGSQTRQLLQDAQEQVEKIQRKQGSVELESPSAYRDGSHTGDAGVSALRDDTGTGRRRSVAGLSDATSPGRQSHTASPQSRDAAAAPATSSPNQLATTGSTLVRMPGGSSDHRGYSDSGFADGLGADERSVLRGGAVGDSPTHWYAD